MYPNNNGEKKGLFFSSHRLLMLTAVLCGPAAAEPVALLADRVIDGVGDSARTNVVVLVDGDRIAAVGDRSIVPDDAKIIELPGTTLMPGMINAHEHPLMYADDYQNAHLGASSAYKCTVSVVASKKPRVSLGDNQCCRSN